jgi:hypothetical protein
MKLIDILGLTPTEALPILLSFDNSLDYNDKADALYEKMPCTTPTKRIALTLCGNAHKTMARLFMDGYDMPNFIDNVAHNSEESIPLIVKAIQLHFANK